MRTSFHHQSEAHHPKSSAIYKSAGRLPHLWVDTVDKVGDEQRAGNNRIQVPRFLNQCCAPDSYLESMLLTRPSKNVYRQHRPKVDNRGVVRG
jgi:hypothetical protein